MNKGIIIAASLAYLALLFLIAWAIERHTRKGRTLRGRSWIYALSLAVAAGAARAATAAINKGLVVNAKVHEHEVARRYLRINQNA